MKYNYYLSIIVPVYNAERDLNNFFKSLLDQEIVYEKIELIMIDNGSNDNTKQIIFENFKIIKYIDFKYFYFDQKADSYAARNYGVNQSSGEVFAFTDSDCILEKKWIKNIIEFSKKSNIISGEVEINVVDKKNIWEIFDQSAHLNNKSNVSKGKVATANLIVFQEDYKTIGYFSEQFSGGDHDWSMRAKKLGFNILFNNQIKVFHPSRKKYSEILNKTKRIAYGFGVKHNRNGSYLYSLILLYFLKIFNIKTNIIYTNILIRNGFDIKSIFIFNLCFFNIRFAQLDSAINGYKGSNARKLGIK